MSKKSELEIKTISESKKVLLKAFQKELQRLPEYLEAIEDPKKKIDVMLKLMPYIFPKSESRIYD